MGRERVVVLLRRKGWEGVPCGQAVLIPTSVLSHLGAGRSPWSRLSQGGGAARIIHSCHMHCRMTVVLHFPPGAEAFLLAKTPKEHCHRQLLRLSTKEHETSHYVPSAVPCSLSRDIC